MIISLRLTLDECHQLSLLPADHDSRDWIEDHATTYTSVCDDWFSGWNGKPILLDNDSHIRQMRDELLARLRETFPSIHFVIEARMRVRKTVMEMVTVR